MSGKHSTVCFLPFFIMGILAFFVACSHENEESADDDDDSSPPCEPTCWQHSPEQATGSQDQIEEWAAECQNADSGCEGRYCVATRLRFRKVTDDLRYSIQCESGVNSESVNSHFCINYMNEYGGDHFDYLWLGPKYGMLSEKTNGYLCDPDPNDAWTVTGWALQGAGGTDASWTAETIQDALIHEITDTPCEEITDLRTCIRSFIPPDIHCTPVFSKIDYATFIGCESKQEPFGRPLGWREMYQE